jgi:hypothetical protein
MFKRLKTCITNVYNAITSRRTQRPSIGLIDMPTEILLMIFRDLPFPQTFGQLPLVCTRFRDMLDLDPNHKRKIDHVDLINPTIRQLEIASKNVSGCQSLKLFIKSDDVLNQDGFQAGLTSLCNNMKLTITSFDLDIKYLSREKTQIAQEWLMPLFNDNPQYLRHVSLQSKMWDFNQHAVCESIHSVELLSAVFDSAIILDVGLYQGKFPNFKRISLMTPEAGVTFAEPEGFARVYAGRLQDL